MISDSAQLMFGIQGTELLPQEVEWLSHPLTAGVILFARNYDNPSQLKSFIEHIREVAKHDILLAVDHEGGRVQRFRHGFTPIPPMALLGKIYDENPETGLQLAQQVAYVAAYEVVSCGIDFIFAPVLDVQTNFSEVIGDRAFHADVNKIGTVAKAFYRGLRLAGTAGVGKHFPGHGNVIADSHLELPKSEASFERLKKMDLPPFAELIDDGIEAIMPAHILYTAVDGMPSGFSNFWLQRVLREELGFEGCIISDDLDMAGAALFGDMEARVRLAARNCDLILLCNNHDCMHTAYATLAPTTSACRQQRLARLLHQPDKLDRIIYQNAVEKMQKTGLL